MSELLDIILYQEQSTAYLQETLENLDSPILENFIHYRFRDTR